MSPIKRASPRRDLKWNVCVIGTDGSLLGYCKTSNVSERGAKLLLQEEFEVPDRFSISFSLDGKVARLCAVVWRKEKTHIGVRFMSPEKTD